MQFFLLAVVANGEHASLMAGNLGFGNLPILPTEVDLVVATANVTPAIAQMVIGSIYVAF